MGILDSNNKTTKSATMPLATDADVNTFDEPWDYDYVMGMLMYLSRNSRPEIKSSVHQCDRFTHNPWKGYSEAVKRVWLYLVGTQVKCLTLDPNSDINLDWYVDANF